MYNYDMPQLVEFDFDDLKPLLNADVIEKISKQLESPQEKKSDKPKQKPSGDKQLLTKMVDLMDMKHCDNRDDWLKIVCAMKNCGFTQEEAREWSMKSDRYTESGFESTWDSYNGHTNTAIEGTIRHSLRPEIKYYLNFAQPYLTKISGFRPKNSGNDR